MTWFAVSAAIALLVPSRLWHYFSPCLPPLVLLASCALGMFWKYRPTGWRSFPVWLVAVWMVAESYPPIRTHLEKLSTVYYWSTQGSTGTRARRIADAVIANTQPLDRIFVAGFDPQIYSLAGRPPASRYAGTLWAFQLPNGGQAIADEIMSDLQRLPPMVIVADAAEVSRLVGSTEAAEAGRPVFRGLDTLLEGYSQPDPELSQVWVFRGFSPGK